jgi:hypothetical protein
MNPKVKAWIDVGGSTFALFFVMAVLMAPLPVTLADWGKWAAALVVTSAVVTRQRMLHPPSGPAVQQLETLVATVEPIIARRFLSNPAMTALLDRFEQANAASLDTASMMVAHSVAGHLKTITDNPPPAVLKAMLDAIPAIAEATPAPPPIPATPAPANDTKGTP